MEATGESEPPPSSEQSPVLPGPARLPALAGGIAAGRPGAATLGASPGGAATRIRTAAAPLRGRGDPPRSGPGRRRRCRFHRWHRSRHCSGRPGRRRLRERGSRRLRHPPRRCSGRCPRRFANGGARPRPPGAPLPGAAATPARPVPPPLLPGLPPARLAPRRPQPGGGSTTARPAGLPRYRPPAPVPPLEPPRPRSPTPAGCRRRATRPLPLPGALRRRPRSHRRPRGGRAAGDLLAPPLPAPTALPCHPRPASRPCPAPPIVRAQRAAARPEHRLPAP